jgi:hypothetical protein
MPRFGGFNIGNIGGDLARNALGSIANAVLPRSTFGGFGLPDSGTIIYPNQNSQDRTVSLRPKPAAANRVYGDGLLKPLKDTTGLIWPYTPTISYQHPIDYQPIQTVHSNQDFHIYSKTPAVSLVVSGEFSVQNQQEGAYAFAAMHFLRTMAKMHFGEQDPDAGTPPPVLLFNAYGPFVFKDLPVIVKEFNMEFPADVDYVQVVVYGGSQSTTTPSRTIDNRITAEPLAPPPPLYTGRGTPEFSIQGVPDGVSNNPGAFGTNRSWGTVSTVPGTTTTAPVSYTVWMPSLFKIACTLIVQHTSKELRQNFDLRKYRNGDPSQSKWI